MLGSVRGGAPPPTACRRGLMVMDVGQARPPAGELARQRVQVVLGQVLGRAGSVDFASGFGSLFRSATLP